MSRHAETLQRAVFAALAGNPEIAALVGPDGLSDHARPGAPASGILMAGIDSRALACLGEALAEAEEHVLRLDVWSFAAGHRQAETLARLATATLTPDIAIGDGLVLADLAWISTSVTTGPEEGSSRAVLAFRAVTQTIPIT